MHVVLERDDVVEGKAVRIGLVLVDHLVHRHLHILDLVIHAAGDVDHERERLADGEAMQLIRPCRAVHD